MDVTVEHLEAEKQFAIDLDGCRAFLDYRFDGGTLVLVHTEVPPELGGRGLGGRIVQAALIYAEEQELTIIPQCPFVASYIEKHSQYQRLVVEPS